MSFLARFQDGQIAQTHDVVCTRTDASDTAQLIVTDPISGTQLAAWPVSDILHPVAASGETRLSCTSAAPGARLIITGKTNTQAANRLLPELQHRSTARRRSHFRMIFGASAALASLILVYIFGIPLLAGRIVAIMPLEWEQQLGESAVEHFESAFAFGEELRHCNADPATPAAKALTAFTNKVLEGQNAPFGAHVNIVNSPVQNAFALPGGEIYYFSGLLKRTESADEFAGIIAHEIGHVVHRHTMEQIVSTAGTGLLVGFVLGDVSGLSFAGGVGAALIDSRFSREAERAADAFAADAAQRLGFDPTAMGELLERVAADSEFTQATSILASHPLTSERSDALERYKPDGPVQPAFSDQDWQAIKTICDT